MTKAGFGRFGRHILPAPTMALDLPSASGRCSFHNYFPEDTHNSYLNAFMSAAGSRRLLSRNWCLHRHIGFFRHVFVRVPWQRAYLAVFAAFLGTVGEKLHHRHRQLRHFWMMLGIDVGHFAAAQRDRQAPIRRSPCPAQAS